MGLSAGLRTRLAGTRGVILDLTLPDTVLAYFPGLRFPGKEGLVEAVALPGMLECGYNMPIFCRIGLGGCESPEFRAAHKAAYRSASILAREGGPQSVDPVIRRLNL